MAPYFSQNIMRNSYNGLRSPIISGVLPLLLNPAPTILASLLILKQTRHLPASGHLVWLFSLLEKLFT